MSLSTLKVLDSFIKLGGKVIWVNCIPTISVMNNEQTELLEISKKYENKIIKYTNATKADIISSISAIIKKPLTIYGMAFVSPYYKNTRQFYYIVNPSKDPKTLLASQSNITSFTLYNPVDGSITTTNGEITLQGYRGIFIEPNYN